MTLELVISISSTLGLTSTNKCGGLIHLNRSFFTSNEPVPQQIVLKELEQTYRLAQRNRHIDCCTNQGLSATIKNIGAQNHGNHGLDIQPERSILRVGQNL